jgi:hypothetical protein
MLDVFFSMLSSVGEGLFREEHFSYSGPGSIVGIATGYGLDGPGIESRWGARFSLPALGPTQSPVQWLPGLSWR